MRVFRVDPGMNRSLQDYFIKVFFSPKFEFQIKIPI